MCIRDSPGADQPLARRGIGGELPLRPDDRRVVRIADDVGACLLYTSDDADDLLCGDHGGRRIIKKKNKNKHKKQSFKLTLQPP